MFSSVNAFGGLSSAELMTLFGTKSPSSVLSSKSTNTDQSASRGVSGASTNNPANAIQAILAQAQIDKTDIEQELTPSSLPSSTNASTAQSAPTPTPVNGAAAQASASVSTANPTGQSESPNISGSTVNNPANTIQAIVAQTQIDTSQIEAPGSAISTEVTYTSDSDAENFQAQTMSFTAETNAQGEEVDSFEFGLTFQGRTVTVGFSIEGLGLSVDSPVQVAGGAMALGNPIGNLGDSFAIGIPGASGQAGNAEFNIYGLDVAQAQQLSAAYEEATLVPADPEKTPSGADLYYGNSGIGFSAQFDVATGFKDLDQVIIPGT